jgi:hypothetical protein
MNKISITWISLVLIFSAQLSCSKKNTSTSPDKVRTIRFVLYTEKDFSGNDENISFSLLIKNHSGVLFDSTLSPMKIKDIPDSTAKLVFDKKVPNDDGLDLAAGFHYDIDGVGISSYLDTCSAGEMFKVIYFSFK